MTSKLFCFVLALAIFSLISSQSEANIDATRTFQTIRGFGGINLPDWIGDLTQDQTRKAFNNGAGDLGFSILRIFVSDDSNSWSKSVATAKLAQSLGAIVFASPWNPPAAMTEQFNEGDRHGKRLRHDKYADYAQHLNNFVNFMKQNGVELYGISIQNEPDYAHEWTWWSSSECVEFLAKYAGQINCRIISPETFQYNKQYYNDILSNGQANANVDIFATHFYGTPRSWMDFPALENDPREIWITEVYVPNSNSDADTWPEAVEVAVNIHNGLVVGNLNAYVWWYIRRSYGPMKENGNISKRGYMMAQYSKYVRPGAVRIDATESPTDGVYISAYKNTDGTIVIVTVNNGNNSYAQKYNINGKTIKSVKRFMTTAGENLAVTENMPLTGNGFYAQTNSKTVSTFVIS